MRYFIFTVLAFMVILALCLGRPGFGTEAQIRNYADPIAEQMLQALSRDDYAAFSQNLGEPLHTSVTAAEFRRMSQHVRESYGVYESKQYYTSAVYPESTVVKYLARFSEVSIGLDSTFEFSEAGGEYSVTGFSIVQAGWLTR